MNVNTPPDGNHRADLGVLGGMGPRATHYFTDELLTALESHCHPQKDQDYPNIHIRYACHLPDRTFALTTDRNSLVLAIKREARILVDIGCSNILMPCISAHALLDSELAQFPFIDIRKVVATHIANSFPKATVGILATRGARVSRALDKLLPPAQPAILLDEQDEDKLMAFIYEDAKTWRRGRDISVLMNLAGRLRQRGCDLIIAGCTEVETCFARYASEKDLLILPLRIAAQFYATTWIARS